jgi:hypothetical protein
MVELMNTLGSERAAQLAERMARYDPSSPPSEEIEESIRAAVTMGYHTLFAWDAVRQFVENGAEGGRAREFVGKACTVIAMWLENVRIAVRIVDRWQKKVTPPHSLAELRQLEGRLQIAQSSGQKLLAFVNEPMPSLTPQDLERLEAAGSGHDESQYLSGQEFLSRVRSRRGA